MADTIVSAYDEPQSEHRCATAEDNRQEERGNEMTNPDHHPDKRQFENAQADGTQQVNSRRVYQAAVDVVMSGEDLMHQRYTNRQNNDPSGNGEAKFSSHVDLEE